MARAAARFSDVENPSLGLVTEEETAEILSVSKDRAVDITRGWFDTERKLSTLQRCDSPNIQAKIQRIRIRCGMNDSEVLKVGLRR